MLDTLHEPEANDLPASLFEETATSRLRLGGQDKPPKPVLGQCFHQITSGHYCNAPALRGEYFCRHHFKRGSVIAPPNTRYELPAITGRESLRTAVLEIAGRVGANSLDIRRAGIMLYSLQIALSTFPPLPRPRAGQKEEQIDTSPEAGLTEAERYRAIIDRFERENGPPPPVVYPADLLPKTGKVEVGHSCFAPPGWKPGDPNPEFDAILLKTRPSTPPAAAAIADEERDEMEKEYLLPDLTACAAATALPAGEEEDGDVVAAAVFVGCVDQSARGGFEGGGIQPKRCGEDARDCWIGEFAGEAVGGEQVEVAGLNLVCRDLRLDGRRGADGARDDVPHRRAQRVMPAEQPGADLLFDERVVASELAQGGRLAAGFCAEEIGAAVAGVREPEGGA
jgi:hypothetical protein